MARVWKIRVNNKNQVTSTRLSINAYEEEEFQSFIFNKTQQFKNQIQNHLYKNLTISKIAGLSFVSLPLNESKQIIDLGGGAGIDYFISRELFDISQQWKCLETEAMCRVMIDKKLKEDNLQFDTLENFLQYTKLELNFSLYTNSALQYFESPIKVLDSLLLRGPKKVAIIRTPFVLEGSELSTLQKSKFTKNGPQVGELSNNKEDISNLVTIERLENIKKVFQQHNYEIVCENTSVGSFTHQKKFRRSRKSLIRTVDLLARRMN
jgi:putative methyltransferase (TIGR04325 family)